MIHRLVLSQATASSVGHQAPLLAPLVLIWLALMGAALIDLTRRKAVRGSKLLWVIVIVFIGTIGPITYFAIGRKEV